jgi:hypothetical protein
MCLQGYHASDNLNYPVKTLYEKLFIPVPGPNRNRDSPDVHIIMHKCIVHLTNVYVTYPLNQKIMVNQDVLIKFIRSAPEENSFAS